MGRPGLTGRRGKNSPNAPPFLTLSLSNILLFVENSANQS